ncbi:uncharacterized protein LOC114535350 [Dendronephthya gigantea]|uniref:uncharacterized protein LOC114535350 n=1 Tax=Dendronephthya gigantea TaxID=151771 RepID=UPI00106CB74A|nr:uncharacterized protein LOC114535350 [Dendronephthya gigantea]
MEMDGVDLMKKISHKDSVDDGEIWKTFQCAKQTTNTATCTSVSDPMEGEDKEETYEYKRSNKSCITLTVGDQGTNKNVRGVKSRSNAAYGWCAKVPGDMHAKGYVYEVCKKVMSPGGFMHILQNVLLRKKITNESFGKKKFQEQNLNRIEEAVRDNGAAFGIAMVMEFKNSTSFPDADELLKCKRSTGNHTTKIRAHDIEETPLLNINAVSCNCSNFYPTQKVLLPPLDNTSESGSSQASQEPSESNENDFGHERTENRDIDDHHWFSDESEERDLLEHLAELENAGEENGDEQSKRNETVNEQISNEDSEEDESEEVESDEEEITHALPFKCIGAAHEQSYQHHLEQAYLALEYNESVNVRLRPEPENPRDQNAIAIDLHYGTQWENVGYIASEHCKYLHPLIAAGDILDVYVEHIKFRG